MRRAVLIVASTFAALALALTAAIVFGTRARPPPRPPDPRVMAVRSSADLPRLDHYRARDGAELAYRAYPGSAPQVAVVLHGSSCDSTCMHAVSQAIHATGATVYALDLRGHGGSGRRGDVDYVGQLDDDLADFTAAVAPAHRGATVTLVGFSAGGALAIHVAGSRYSERFDRFVVLAPALVYPRGIARPGGGGWAAPFVPRIVGLTLLDAIGVHTFDGLDAIAFAVAPTRTDLTPTYSYRLAMSLAARDYPAALRRTRQPMTLLVGSDDEQFDPSRYGPVLTAYKPDLAVRVVPGVRHQSLTFDPAALSEIARAFN